MYIKISGPWYIAVIVSTPVLVVLFLVNLCNLSPVFSESQNPEHMDRHAQTLDSCIIFAKDIKPGEKRQFLSFYYCMH